MTQENRQSLADVLVNNEEAEFDVQFNRPNLGDIVYTRTDKPDEIVDREPVTTVTETTGDVETVDPEKLALQQFVKDNLERCAMWHGAHGNYNFPIIKTKQGYTWMSRQSRRQALRKKLKERKRW